MSVLQELKEQIRVALPDLDMVLGWEQGFDSAHMRPLYIREEQDIERLVLNPLCVHSLATYLPGLLRGGGNEKKVGIVVKGCDSRAVIQLIQENLIPRERVVMFGFGCNGIVSLQKIEAIAGDSGYMESVEFTGDKVVVSVDGKKTEIPMADVASGKCATCRHHNAIDADHFAGPRAEDGEVPAKHPTLEEFEKLSLPERFAFWQEQMRRCVRCYACRNTCPMCVCRDHCIATSRDPHWLSQDTNTAENFMFQMIHVMHLAGRCVECGECERACPLDIPIMLLRRSMNESVKELFDYSSGTDKDATPPLLTYKVEEETINERGW
ncbi:4Fe-4S dicluster domain-containing protein [Oleidesulfovibrio sp.]|uniref:4Fe-4S dicluster domain-containing protein n=1 Tax=Oleidesulfovibrio sp. TaxID=2909707 RepID=UPI003A88C923